MFNVNVLDNDETPIQLLDDELCDVIESNERGGLKTIELKYWFDDYNEVKELFKLGNKLYVNQILYIINTKVEADIYEENLFHVFGEEVLTELNYAPLFSQIELTKANGFDVIVERDQISVGIDFNALNYWFGDYFNIGTIQEARNPSHNRISFYGSLNLMKLLRLLEERTGNIFVTRYERDVNRNIIHRYLDFLNPFDENKDWEYCFVYDEENLERGEVYDANGNLVNDYEEDVYEYDDYTVFDEEFVPRLTLESNYKICLTDNDNNSIAGCEWSLESLGWTKDYTSIIFRIKRVKNTFVLSMNEKQFIVYETDRIGDKYGWYINDAAPKKTVEADLPLELNFVIKNADNIIVYKNHINYTLGKTHKEILDLGFNVENVIYEIDENETFNGAAPELKTNDNINRTDMNNLLKKWKNFSILKGDIIPFTIEKISYNGNSVDEVISKLGQFELDKNYYSRPYHPKDDPGKKYEFYRALNYYQAPFTKLDGDLEIKCEDSQKLDYDTITGRPDKYEAFIAHSNKIKPVEIEDEDLILIYNKLAEELQKSINRHFEIKTKVANLKGSHSYNQYTCNDKVFIKLPGYNQIISAKVNKTSHYLNNMKDNTVELSDYDDGTRKTIMYETIIHAENFQLKYPERKKYTVRLENLDYEMGGSQYPANQLISFNVYHTEAGRNKTLSGKVYNVITNYNGYASISIDWLPDNYELDIFYNGDAQYAPSTTFVNVNVHGTVDKVKVKNTSKKKPKGPKTSRKRNQLGHNSKYTRVKTVRKERYYSKYGVSPDGKYLIAIGRRSTNKDPNVSYKNFYQTVFYRRCANCGSTNLVWNIFYRGKETVNNDYNPAVGKAKGANREGEVTCRNCDCDYSIFGNEKSGKKRPGLKIFKDSVRVPKSKVYLLKRGKFHYDTLTKQIVYDVRKKYPNTKAPTRYQQEPVPPKLIAKATSIAGKSVGTSAAKKIVKWCRKHVKYNYYNGFHHKPLWVYNNRKGNCCDSARFVATMLDAAGCMEKLNVNYVHVQKGGRGHVFLELITVSSGYSRWVDITIKKAFWGGYYKKNGTVKNNLKHKSRYPNLPF